ncbi:MAG: NAD-glutamate dehydrogenase, partial [Alphaproteobacteria bacterium]|nr:NAD-glutamate dehydrogenase [Alphaproteobacteria bacterium]
MNKAADISNPSLQPQPAVSPQLAELVAKLQSVGHSTLPNLNPSWDWDLAVSLFYQHISPADRKRLATADQADGLLGMVELAGNRVVGEPNLRLSQRADGLVVEIVTDDMPFLIDSVTAILNQAGLTVNLVVHPIMNAIRDGDGRLMALAPLTDRQVVDKAMPKAQAVLESWQQFHTTGALAPAQIDLVKARLDNVLRDVRYAVSDWQGMRQRLKAMQDRLQDSGLPQREVAEVQAFLSWLDDGHFTFLGSRSLTYQPGHSVVGGDGQDANPEDKLVVVEDSGLGVLRDSSITLFAGARRLSDLSAKAKEFILLGGTLSIVKTSQLATVHRPVLMDAIGLRFFDNHGVLQEVCWFVGL